MQGRFSLEKNMVMMADMPWGRKDKKKTLPYRYGDRFHAQGENNETIKSAETQWAPALFACAVYIEHETHVSSLVLNLVLTRQASHQAFLF